MHVKKCSSLIKKFILCFIILATFLHPHIVRSQTVSDLVLSPTFNAIGIEVKNTTSQSGVLEFKKTSDTVWRKGLDMWQAGSALYGSVLLISSGTSYDIRVTPSGGTPLTGTVSTRLENIPQASNLTPSRFVRSDGNDNNLGTSDTSTGAWKTIQKAVSSAPDGAIVQVGPGNFKMQGSLTRSITLKAQYPAVDDNRVLINTGKHTILDWGATAITSPAGSPDPNPGVWQQVTLTGPATGEQFQIWKLANTKARSDNGWYGPGFLGFAATKQDIPRRVGLWTTKCCAVTDKSGKTWTMQTPEGWTELVYKNIGYNYGWTGFTNSTGGEDIYARFPGDVNPNSVYTFQGQISIDSSTPGYQVFVNGPDIRITGFEFRAGGVALYPNAIRSIIDHNALFDANVVIQGAQPSTYGSDHVIQYNSIIHTSLWSLDHSAANEALPWCFIKCGIYVPDGSGYWSRTGADGGETTGINSYGGAKRVVIRYNTIDGPFNGIGNYNTNFDRYSEEDQDIHDNVIKHISDDALEPEGTEINWRIWNNHIDQTGTVLSTGPVSYGPIYLFRNQAWMTGMAGIGRYPDPTFPDGNPSIGSTFFKSSGSSNPTARIYVINNTFWTNDRILSSTGALLTGVEVRGQYAGGGTSPESFYSINNIMRSTRYTGTGQIDDYNAFATSDESRGYNKYTTNVQAYRDFYKTTYGVDTHTNIGWDATTGSGNFIDTTFLDNGLASPQTGDLTLKQGSIYVNAGTIVPNISDQLGINYTGSAPDLGAIEYGLANGTPTPSLGNGDANGDGNVTISDIIITLQNFLNSLTGSIDQFGDGRINSLDVVRVINLLP